MLKNTIYIVILTFINVTVLSLRLCGIWPNTQACFIAYFTACGLLGCFIGAATIIMLGWNFGLGKLILIAVGWMLHCMFYSIVIVCAVEVVRIFFA